MLNKNTVLKLGKYVLKRLEHNLNKGTIILFDTNSFNIWYGNESVNDILKLIDGTTTLETLYNTILPLYNGYSSEDVIESFNSILEELIEKKFLEIK